MPPFSQIYSGALLVIVLGLSTVGCVSKSHSRLESQNAFLAGQNAALRQQLAQYNGITFIGAVKNAQVPWVAGLTLVQAVATAEYIGQDEPRAVVITRQGESAVLDADVLFNGKDVPLEAGDIVELR
ncbi:MAG TPA: hypothetical protein VK742_18170 [Candidatus Sulfotelmatobacter sp.]|jgi:hypothetical protein|nr:hypothetical protein [Candidatus Sulfotelmatobacter sp.]